MVNRMPEVPIEMHVGDARALSFQFEKATRIEVQGLTGPGYASRWTFAYSGEAPHIIRHASVDGVNGLSIYDMLGDELTKIGTVEVYAEVMPTDLVGPGQSFMRTSSDIMRITVMRKPS